MSAFVFDAGGQAYTSQMSCESLKYGATLRASLLVRRFSWLRCAAFPAGTIRVSLSKMFWTVQLISSLWNGWSNAPHVLPQILAKALHLAGASDQQRAFFKLLFFFLIFSFHQIGTGILSRSFCSFMPSGYWPSLDNPEADCHVRYPYGCDSAGWATVARVERGPFPCVLFSHTHLG